MPSKGSQRSPADQAGSVSTEESKTSNKKQESFSQESLKLVSIFEQFDKETNEETCQDVLLNVFQLGKNVENINTKDKEKIAKVLQNKARFLYMFLFDFGFNFDSTYSLLLLKFRSALEFLNTIYGSFPLDEDEKALQKILLNLEKEINPTGALDEAIHFLKENLYESIEPEGFTYEDLIKPSRIPNKHSWWFTYED